MSDVTQSLRRIAREKHCCILVSFLSLVIVNERGDCGGGIQVTNHLVSSGTDRVRPALGETWAQFADVRVLLSRASATGARAKSESVLVASLAKSNKSVSSLLLLFSFYFLC